MAELRPLLLAHVRLETASQSALPFGQGGAKPTTQARRASPRPAPWHAGRGSEGVIISSRVCVAHGYAWTCLREKAKRKLSMRNCFADLEPLRLEYRSGPPR